MSTAVVLCGPRHAGKTTALLATVARLRACGFSPAGIISHAVHDGNLVGYDVEDLATGERAPLARVEHPGPPVVGRFGFLDAGLELGKVALLRAIRQQADPVFVDEVGPLELRGDGWADPLDDLAGLPLRVILSVRESLVPQVIARWKLGTVRQVSLRPAPQDTAAAVLAALDLAQ